MNTLRIQGHFPLVGYGRLHLKNGHAFAASYRTVVSVDNLTGGGIVTGNSLLLQRAAEEGIAVLEVGPKRYLALAVGPENAGEAPVAVLGNVRRVAPITELRSEEE